MEQLMQTFVYPFLLTLATALLGLGVAWTRQRLHIEADATANSAVQSAVANFAGQVATDVATGKISLQMVQDGHVNKALVDYAAGTVGDSLTRLGVTPATLATMLVGKLADKLNLKPQASDVVPTTAPSPAPVLLFTEQKVGESK